MSLEKIYQDHLKSTLNKLDECSDLVETIEQMVIEPTDSEDKADLLIRTEDLVKRVSKLYEKVYKNVWHTEFQKEMPTEG
jgi:hypothetical protein